MRKNRTQGFTLIELLIVIAIIAILAAVLIPNLLAARKRANDTVVTSYLSDVAKFEEMYQIDNNEYTADHGDLTALGLKDLPDNTKFWAFADANYYCIAGYHTGGTKIIYVTPASGVYKGTQDADPTGGTTPNTSDCKDVPTGVTVTFSAW